MEHYQRPQMRHATRRKPYDPVIRSGRDLTLCLLTLGAVVQSTWILDGIIRALTYIIK
jgi:hypothetical protein